MLHTEKGKDKTGWEYERSANDFHFKWLVGDHCVCSICHGEGAKIEVNYITRDYASNHQKNKICKKLQAHEHSVWICRDCLENFVDKRSVIIQRNLLRVLHCVYCGGVAERKQIQFKTDDGEDRYKNEHHEDGSLKWSYLECTGCHRKTKAYCYEYQSTEKWNRGETEIDEKS